MTTERRYRKYTDLGFEIRPLYAVDDLGYCRCGIEGCPSPGKHPIPRYGWTKDKRRAASFDLYLPETNIGLRIPPFMLVIDIDSKFDILQGYNRTPKVETLKGFHYYFKNDLLLPRRIRAEKDIDVLTNGYVVAPPSVTYRNGSFFEYKWIRDIWNSPIERISSIRDMMGGMFQKILDPPKKVYDPYPEDTQTFFDGELSKATTAISQASQGSRHTTLTRFAFKMGQIIHRDETVRGQIIKKLITSAIVSGLSEREATSACTYCFEAGERNPR